MNVRAVAGKILYQVIVEGASLTQALATTNNQITHKKDLPLLQMLCYGVCRWYFRLDAIAKHFLKTPLKEKDEDVYILLLVGLFQLTETRIPDYAAVGETVNAAKKLKKKWAVNLVNGVLREYLRSKSEVKINSNSALYSHPQWMINKITQSFPDKWQAILEANNEHPPFSLRVNTKLISREQYLEVLNKAEIEAEPLNFTTSGIKLKQPIDVYALPGFSEGQISVQDGAAQLAAELLNVQPNQRILDACAAPGGKTAHILELGENIECVAVEIDKERLKRVEENLKRLKLSATCIEADAADPQKWWDGKQFDRILLDSPCSATGVIRRHPDIKLLRRESDLAQLAETQLTLLHALWPLLKPGGVLLYATCSIFSEENSRVVETFMSKEPSAKIDVISGNWGIDCKVGKQILPGMHDMDGFYYARLQK